MGAEMGEGKCSTCARISTTVRLPKLCPQLNAEVFGGDPSNILLMGSGSGAACASILALSPRAEGMLQIFLDLLLFMQPMPNRCKGCGKRGDIQSKHPLTPAAS